MAYEPKLIAPFKNSGLVKYWKPWIVGDEAFPEIDDAYAWRGAVRKREGFEFLASFPGADAPVQGLKTWINPSSLSENLIGFSRTKSYFFNNGTGLFQDMTFFAYPTGVAVPITGAAFSFSNGADDYFWTSNYAGSLWETNNLTADHIKYWNGTVGVLNTSGGWSTFQPVIDGAPTTLDAALIILPYKGRLVVLNTSEGGNSFPNRARWSQIGTPYAGAAAPVAISTITPANTTAFTTASDLFTTGQNVSFFGVTGADAGLLNGVNTIITRVGAGSYTVPINTAGKTINNSGFVQQLGNPPSPFVNDINAWRSDIPGKGGFVDADTSERIVSADIVKDTLIVAFQRSTWRLRYTGNEILPFIWERLNTQYGAESTFSNVAFDEAVLFFSRYGWISSDTNNVARIDEDIPDDSFDIESIDSSFTGLKRVQGIRDFYRQFAYWTYPVVANTTYNKIYAYNYLDRKWFTFTPISSNSPQPATPLTIRTFGYYRTLQDITWQILNNAGPTPPADSWENFNSPDDTWNGLGGGNDNFPYIVGGDANGNVYQMFEFQQAPANDNGVNFSFNIMTKRFNPYIQEGMKAKLAYVDIYCTTLDGGEITLNHLIDDQSSPIATRTVELFKRGIINISSVTPATPTRIITSTPHGLSTGQTVTLANIGGTIGNVLNNQTFVATVTTTTTFFIPINTNGFAYTSGGVIYNAVLPGGDANYVRVFLGAIGYMHQLQLTLTPSQLADPVKGTAQFELQGLVTWWRREGRIRR